MSGIVVGVEGSAPALDALRFATPGTRSGRALIRPGWQRLARSADTPDGFHIVAQYFKQAPATSHRGSGITDASPLCRSPGWQPPRHSASTIGRRRAALRSGDRPVRPRRTHPQPYALNRSPPEPHRRTGCGARTSRPRRPSSEAERRRAGGGRSPLRLSVRVVRHSRSVPVECRLSGALMKASASGRDEAPGHALQPLGALEQPMGRARSHGRRRRATRPATTRRVCAGAGSAWICPLCGVSAGRIRAGIERGAPHAAGAG
jgi:hypothetical protein